ncbi:unnamed protein product, partial [Prorocentrum cordatum]
MSATPGSSSASSWPSAAGGAGAPSGPRTPVSGVGSQGPGAGSQSQSPMSSEKAVLHSKKDGSKKGGETGPVVSAEAGAGVLPGRATLNQYFEESDNPDMMDILFGSEMGNVRLARIFETYEVRPSPVAVSFFDAAGDRMIHGDPVNRETQRATLFDLKESIRQRGLVPGVAGEAWFVCSPGETSPFYALSWGHRTRAVYELIQEDPDWKRNPQLASTVKAGVMARRLTYKMPKFVKKFLVDYHNSQAFQTGSGYTYIELLLEVDGMVNAWQVWKSDSISSRGKDYEQKYWQFVSQKYGDKLKSWSHFDSAKTLANRLVSFGVEHCDWARNHVDFMHPKLHHPSVIGIMHGISSTVFNCFNGYMCKGDVSALMSEALKFAVPVRPNPPTQRRLPWIFDKSQADAQEKISFVLFVIDDNAKQPRDQALSLVVSSRTDEGESRERNIGDDIMSCLNVAISSVEVDSQCREMLDVKAELASYALEFLWQKKVMFKGTMFSAWSTLRALLAESAAESAVKFKTFAKSSDYATAGDADDAGSGAAAAPPSSLLQSLRSHAQESPTKMFDELIASKHDTVVAPLLTLLSHNNAMNIEVRFHLDYPLVFREICEKVGPAPSVRLRDFLELC